MPPFALCTADAFPWRKELVATLAALGADVTTVAMPGAETAFAWWVPDFAADACPLYAAVRASLLTTDEVNGRCAEEIVSAGLLRAPILHETAARERFAELLRTHLARFEEDGAGVDTEAAAQEEHAVASDAAEEAAVRLVTFERDTLLAHVKAFGTRAV